MSSTPTATSNGDGTSKRITRADIEAKLEELQGEVDEGVESARGVAIVVGVGAVVVGVVLAYWLGRRAGRKRQTVVEVRRL